MKVVAYLGVKDDVELLDHTIAHLRLIGVDHIIAIDDFSTDGSAEILAAHRCDDFTFIQKNPTELDVSVELVRQTNADWAMFLDADEYWLPKSGSLKDGIELQRADILSVSRYNVPLTPSGVLAPHASVPLTPVTYDSIFFFGALDPVLDHVSSPWISIVPAPKVMARPEHLGVITQGFHSAEARGKREPRRAAPSDLVIAHFPFTTLTRFRRKVDNIRAFLTNYPNYFAPGTARHWRRWVALADESRLDDEFTKQILNLEKITEMRSRGVIRPITSTFSTP